MADQTEAAASPLTTASPLRQFIASEAEGLLPSLRVFMVRAGLASGRDVSAAAAELLNDVVAEALQHEDRFQPGRQPKAWLLGIAANLVKRRQVVQAKRARREPLVRDFYPDAALSEGELFDRLAALTTPSAETELVATSTVQAILSSLEPDDQQVIWLAVLQEMDGRALARALGVKPGTARMRLHRALNRLRQAWPPDAAGSRYNA